jgi:hypothetical protein
MLWKSLLSSVQLRRRGCCRYCWRRHWRLADRLLAAGGSGSGPPGPARRRRRATRDAGRVVAYDDAHAWSMDDG